MGLLSQDQFFTKLTTLFDHRKGQDHGAIYLAQKRFSFGQPAPQPTPENPFPELSPDKPLPILIRATNGKSVREGSANKKAKKIKLSTLVEPDDLEAFYARYAEVCKTGMAALKPRDRSKRKTKTKAKKKKGGATAA